MAVNISDSPRRLFLDLMNRSNPHLKDFKDNEIDIQYIKPYVHSEWPRAVETITDAAIPSNCKAVAPTINWNHKGAGFVLRKDVDFPGGFLTVSVGGYTDIDIYIDGSIVFSTTASPNRVTSKTVLIWGGRHEIAVHCKQNFNNAASAFTITNRNGFIVKSDRTWACLETAYWPLDDMLVSNSNMTSSNIDILVEPSEIEGDYVRFNYSRIPIEHLFGLVDKEKWTPTIEIRYNTKDAEKMFGVMENFETVFNHWHRFSHSGASRYPSDPDDLLHWEYLPDVDCIQSTKGTKTFSGFISDDFAEDYIFNTVLTSDSKADDAMVVVLAALLEGDIDDREHTLACVCTRGGTNINFVRVEDNYRQSDNKLVKVIDPTKSDKWNKDNGWGPWYCNVYARRTGSNLYVYVYMNEIPTLPNKTRDEVMQSVIKDIATLTEDDMKAQGYLRARIKLHDVATKFNRPVRFGYGQRYQNDTRFWNVVRPNDNPLNNPGLQQWFLDKCGLNIGDEGVTITHMGGGKYKVSFDNITYRGDVYLTPK